MTTTVARVSDVDDREAVPMASTLPQPAVVPEVLT